ncbi:unnamed protein product [Blepharisma stoltei]|uniref:RING-type domain-containing protein n=1 Tax=Blepharisma stoltei TaxID=1481888 RepID=A0AAU9IZ58_9CILI|nr:unnamed protein product [Blepharisma stoltei]
MDDFQCPLCLKLLLKPASITCGHTFCKSCLIRSLTVQKKCPVCRVNYPFPAHDLPVNFLIQNLIQKQFPDELKERKAEEVQDEIPQAIESLPVLLIKNVTYFPSSMGILDIFENRYMTMLQNATMGNRTFGLLSNFKGSWLGALLEVVSVENARPGVARVHVLSKNRFTTDYIFPQQDTSRRIKVEEIGKNEFKSDLLYCCRPKFIVDEYDEVETISQNEVIAFTDACVNLLSIDEQRVLRETFHSNNDKSFYVLSLLRLPHKDTVRAFLSISQNERFEICKKHIADKRISRAHLKLQDHGPFSGNFGFLLIIVVVLIIIFYERIK